MITVTPIQEKSEQARLCAACGIPFREELLAYHAKTDGVFAGICQFKMDAEGGHIYDLTNPLTVTDTEALFVMGRAALNFIDLCEVHLAFFEGTADDALLRRIGFTKNSDEKYVIDLTNFFKHPCSHAAH